MSPDPASLGSTPSTVIAGGPANAMDWIGFYAEGRRTIPSSAWCYLNGTKTVPLNGMAGATVGCFVPDAAGRFQARLFLNNTFTKLATSNTITVQVAPPRRPPPAGPSVALTPNPATIGASLSAVVNGGPANTMDWIALYPEGAADNNFIAWCYLNSTKTAPASGLQTQR